jgi:chaperonin GroES
MYDRIVLKREQIKQTAGGIIIPDTHEAKRTDRAVVVSVGRGKRLVSGGIAEPIVKAGDSVIFDKHRGVPVSVDGAELLMVFEDDILAVVV